jgi:hypothetical protein
LPEVVSEVGWTTAVGVGVSCESVTPIVGVGVTLELFEPIANPMPMPINKSNPKAMRIYLT